MNRTHTPLIALCVFVFLGLAAKAQQKESFNLFDKKWTGTTTEKKARYLLRMQAVSDTCWQFDYYNFTGPLIRSEQCRNEKGELKHGTTRYYNADGNLDSIASYRNGKMHGDFYKLGLVYNKLCYLVKYTYENDRLVETIDLQKRQGDTTKYADEKESVFPGGALSWQNLLNKNLRYPTRAMDLNRQGTVSVAFTVDTDGTVYDPFIYHSVEYSLDAETMRIILLSGNWTPGFQNGQYWKTYKIQPLTFRME